MCLHGDSGELRRLDWIQEKSAFPSLRRISLVMHLAYDADRSTYLSFVFACVCAYMCVRGRA